MAINLTLPGSKSLTNRALVLAALKNGETTIKNAAICEDTLYMIKGLRKMGIKINRNANTIQINSKGKFPIKKNTIKIFTGNAGTTTRFLAALSTLTSNKIVISGSKRMQKRPIRELTQALQKLGAQIQDTKGCPPLYSNTKKLEGGNISLAGNISSQYLSALLLSCPFAKNNSRIKLEQEICSKPYITITLDILEKAGIKIKNKNFIQFDIKGNQKIHKDFKEYTIEGDASSASYPAAYIALHPQKELLLKNINDKSIQGDIKFLKYLEKMGCEVKNKGNDSLIKGPQELSFLGEVDMNETPDLVMTFAVLSAFCKGKTKINNIGNLRIKESDRISALENELKKLGIEVKSGKDYIEITGNPILEENLTKKSLNLKSYDDHRMVMSFGILRDLCKKLEFDSPDCVQKSYANFWKDLSKLEISQA